MALPLPVFFHVFRSADPIQAAPFSDDGDLDACAEVGDSMCRRKLVESVFIGSIWDGNIYLLIYHKNQPNVGKYTIHGWYGVEEFSYR